MTKSMLAAAAMGSLMLFVGAANAADVGPAPFEWTGFYVGVNGGLASGHSKWEDAIVSEEPDAGIDGKLADFNMGGGFGGAQIGYNYQIDSIILGAEASARYGSINGSAGCIGGYGDQSADCTTDVRWLGDITARIGFVPTERLMVYAKGGVAFQSADYQPDMVQSYSENYKTTTDSSTGWVVGAGLDFAVTDNIIVGMDYGYYDFGNQKVNFKPQLDNEYTPPFSSHVSDHVNVLSAKLSYKFW